MVHVFEPQPYGLNKGHPGRAAGEEPGAVNVKLGPGTQAMPMAKALLPEHGPHPAKGSPCVFFFFFFFPALLEGEDGQSHLEVDPIFVGRQPHQHVLCVCVKCMAKRRVSSASHFVSLLDYLLLILFGLPFPPKTFQSGRGRLLICWGGSSLRDAAVRMSTVLSPIKATLTITSGLTFVWVSAQIGSRVPKGFGGVRGLLGTLAGSQQGMRVYSMVSFQGICRFEHAGIFSEEDFAGALRRLAQAGMNMEREPRGLRRFFRRRAGGGTRGQLEADVVCLQDVLTVGSWKIDQD